MKIYTDEYCSRNFKNSGKDASLPNREDFGADGGTEAVGDIIGTDSESKDERYDESKDDDP